MITGRTRCRARSADCGHGGPVLRERFASWTALRPHVNARLTMQSGRPAGACSRAAAPRAVLGPPTAADIANGTLRGLPPAAAPAPSRPDRRHPARRDHLYALYDNHVAMLLDEAVRHRERLGLRDQAAPPEPVPATACSASPADTITALGSSVRAQVNVNTAVALPGAGVVPVSGIQRGEIAAGDSCAGHR
jgi:hypothetical protein